MNTELRRRLNNDIPSLKRCSTTSLSPIQNENDETDEEVEKQRFSFFHFDSLNYASTEWRNDQMSQCLKHEAKVISHFGSNVNFTSCYHYTQNELEPHRFVGDPEMDSLLDYLADEDGGCGAFDDVVARCGQDYNEHISLSNNVNTQNEQLKQPAKFYARYNKIPSWVDFEQIQRGIDAFLAYLPAAGCALYYRSLIGGFSIPKIVEVLIATRYLVPASMRGDHDIKMNCSSDDRKRTMERLLDTGGFMACCFAPPKDELPASSLRPGGKGWEAALRVRVLHAKIRRALVAKPSWDTELNGVPINQEDMAATLLAFSVNVLMGIEFVAGKPLSWEDQRDYLALWRYLGWLLGVDTPEDGDGSSNSHDGLAPIDPCGPQKYSDNLPPLVTKDSILHAYATLESMILHLLHPTSKSSQLVNHLLSFNGKVHFRSEVCRKFLGDPLSDKLDILQCSSRSTKFLVYLFLMFLRCYTLLAMAFPRIRRMLIVWHGALQKRFLVAWEVNHDKRIGVAMGKGLDMGVESNKSCPFSMLMPPVH